MPLCQFGLYGKSEKSYKPEKTHLYFTTTGIPGSHYIFWLYCSPNISLFSTSIKCESSKNCPTALRQLD